MVEEARERKRIQVEYQRVKGDGAYSYHRLRP